MHFKTSILPTLALAGALLIPADRLAGTPVIVPGGTVITRWSGYFEADAMVGLRLMKRNADGTFTSDGESGYVYAAGGPQTFDTHIEVPEGEHAIALGLRRRT